MKKFVCAECDIKFESLYSDSDFVNILSAKCPTCNSYNVDLTPQAKLIRDRKLKIKKLNKNGL